MLWAKASASAYNNRCWARALLGQFPQALSDCSESLRLRPGDVNTLDSRGFTYLKAGWLAEAVAELEAELQAAKEPPASKPARKKPRNGTFRRDSP